MIVAENLVKDFGARRAADDVSFSLERGEVLGFLGPNGAGKTTTMRMLAGCLEPDGGRALIDDVQMVYGSGISDGNRHNHDELPVLLIGKGSGKLKPGRHVRYARNTPLNNLHLRLLDNLGVRTDALGDGTGLLGKI